MPACEFAWVIEIPIEPTRGSVRGGKGAIQPALPIVAFRWADKEVLLDELTEYLRAFQYPPA